MASLLCKQDVPLDDSSLNIVRLCGESLKQLLKTRFNCEASVWGLDLDSGSAKAIAPEKRFATVLPSGVTVSVWKADLTNFSVKAVVNAANSRLQHFGGLALALSHAGGPVVQRDSDDYTKKHGDLPTGEVVALRAGKLKCDWIIHAVGPQLHSFRPNAHEISVARPHLQRAVRKVLQLVEEHHIDTVAIPAISSGIFNYPLSDCADTIVSTVVKFYGSTTSNRFRPKEVLLVNHDEPTVKEMERACSYILAPPPSYSQAASTKPTTGGSKGQGATTGGSKGQGATTGGSKGQGATTGGSKGQGTTTKLGMVQVILRKGKLEEQQMDVIVNTASANKDLSVGRVSKALLTRAGRKMQEEIKVVPQQGSIMITNSYSLHCKEVYHTFCPERSVGGSDQILFFSVRDCLWSAVTAQHRSIAFPAIGTGALGFVNREAAQIMLSAVMDFSQKCLVPFEVHFVIFQYDNEVFKAFEEELKSLRSKAAHMEFPLISTGFPGPPQNMNSRPDLFSAQEQVVAAWSVDDSAPPRAEPCISLRAPSEESALEAEAWLKSLLFNTFSTAFIYNNFISLLGEEQLTDLCRGCQGVQLEEVLEKGQSGFIVSGGDKKQIAVAAVKIEEILSQTQEEFIREEQQELWGGGGRRVRGDRSPVSTSHPDLKPVVSQLRHDRPLRVVKAEKVDNPVLEKLFHFHQSQMSSSSSSAMFQVVPAQFCDMVVQIGFRPECAPPVDPMLGDGIYFADDVRTALKLWSAPARQKFVYVVLSKVLKGSSGPGRPGLVLPPALGSDPTRRYDSVEQAGVTVVFNHLQALPRYILTCTTDAGASMTSL